MLITTPPGADHCLVDDRPENVTAASKEMRFDFRLATYSIKKTNDYCYMIYRAEARADIECDAEVG